MFLMLPVDWSEFSSYRSFPVDFKRNQSVIFMCRAGDTKCR